MEGSRDRLDKAKRRRLALLDAQTLKLPRTVMAPAPSGSGAVNRIVSVVIEEDQDVIWEWTHLPGGGRFVSGYTIVPRLTALLPRPRARRKRG